VTDTIRRPAPPTTEPVVPPSRRRWLAFSTLTLVIVLGWGVGTWWAQRPVDVRDGTDAVTADGLAARHGIDVNLIAVTAAGGLVELRYQVVDPDKAAPILHDPELAPALVDEETGATLVMSAPPHRHGGDLQLGATYYFLMANAHNALRPGEQVTLVIGNARLEHIVAQG
jgi:hypothetical protein